MATAPVVPAQIFRPEYIRFLLNPSTPIDFHVNVKHPTSDEMEQIKAVRWMLIARSKVLRVMLLESKLKTGEEFDITDIDPETFKHFLTYIYGYDNTSSLPFEDAVKLLGAAEKYDVGDLKEKLATEITPLVTVDNICTVLQHGPVCDTVPAIWNKVTETIQSQTHIVFEQENFLNLRSEGVVFILQQEALSAPEIDIWRAALKWTRHQLYMNNGLPTPQSLRTTMVPLLQHTRLCTLTHAELCTEVLPTQILTPEEFNYICLSITQPKYASSLDQVNSRTDLRETQGNKRAPFENFPVVKTIRMEGPFKSPCMLSAYKISTKKSKIKLQSIEFMARPHLDEGLSYNCQATINVMSSTLEVVKEINFNKEIPYNDFVAIPLDVKLEAKTKYTVEVRFVANHLVIYYKSLKEMRKITGDLDISGAVHEGTECRWSHIRNWYYQTR